MLWSGSAACRHSTKMSGLACPSSLLLSLSTSAWWNDSPTPALAHVLKAQRTALRATFLRTSSQRLPNAYVKVRRFQAHRRTKRSLFTRVRGSRVLGSWRRASGGGSMLSRWQRMRPALAKARKEGGRARRSAVVDVIPVTNKQGRKRQEGGVATLKPRRLLATVV